MFNRIFFVFYLLCKFRYCDLTALSMPSILWDPRNPMFDEDQCGTVSREFSVKFEDILCVVCGNIRINNALKSVNEGTPKFYYNLFMTESKDQYINRIVNKKEQLVHMCKPKTSSKQEIIVDSYNLVFRRYSKYVEGNTYYFFTTADGSQESLNNTKGVTSSKHMRFSVYICKESDDCPQRHRINPCIGGVTMSGRYGQSYNPSLTKAQFVLVVLAALIGGVILGVIGMFMQGKCRSLTSVSHHYGTTAVQGSSSSTCPLSKEFNEKKEFLKEDTSTVTMQV